MANKKRKRTGIGLAVWFIAAIVIVIIFLVKWETIHNNLIKAGLLQGTIIEKEEKAEAETPNKKEDTKKKNEVTLKVQEAVKSAASAVSSDSAESKTSVNTEKKSEDVSLSVSDKNTEKPAEINVEKTSEKSADKPKENPSPKPVPSVTTTVKLCFVNIDASGSVNYKMVPRTVNRDSPLTNAINQLLEGPSFQNASEKNCTTLIPRGTKLLSASIKDGVAILNFNESFEYNTEGIEGYLAQLKQIINTATEFSSVKSVQFMINGQKKEYLGSDGVWIGTPLGRGSL